MLTEGEYHCHDFAEITYIISGKGRYLLDGSIYDVGAGDVVMCNPGVMHKNIVTDLDEPTVEFYTGFTDFQFRDMPPNSILLRDHGYILHTSAETRQELTRHCYEMAAEQEGCQPGKYFMLKTYLIQMLLLILRETIPKEKSHASLRFESYNRNYVVKKIIGFLNENYAEKISLDQIAGNMYLSPVYISKIFKEETGESPINYLIKIRLEKACSILKDQEDFLSIRDIAKSVGYEDVYHFSKLFKKYYGTSPLNYKKSTLK